MNMTQREKIKQHFRDNKKVYIGTAVGVLVGAASAVLILKYNNVKVTQQASQNALVNYKPTIHQEQIVMMELPPRGHRGFAILNDKTGEVYGSLRNAAEKIGCSTTVLRDHLNGLHDDVFGNTYTNLGENLSGQYKVSV